jgi:histone-lysine N-methyltransferase SUV420H
VYHIAQEDSDDSETEEKDKETKADKRDVTKQEEKDMSSELSSFLSSSEIPSDQSPVRARTSLGVGMMTPDTDTAASPSSHVLASAATDTDELPRKNTPTTPFKSIIATRRQKAAAAESSTPTPTPTTVTKTVKVKSQLVTPPPSVETSSLPDETTAQVIEKRLTRSASSAKLNDSADTKATSSKRKGKAKETDREYDKEETEEPEVTRVLRTRPSVHANLCVIGSPVKPEVPRDERGRPLPTCITCFNILPIIHVDQEVVWGVGKKKEMPECPRFVCFMLT